VTFEEVGNKTRLTFSQEPFASVESRDSHLSGWGECLDRMQSYLEAARGGASAYPEVTR
jgi:hypothetical protein